MKLVDQNFVDAYLEDDWVAAFLSRPESCFFDACASQSWLHQSKVKRAIFASLYGDILRGGSRLKIADVGGGLSAFSKTLSDIHDYTLVDIMAHDYARKQEISEAIPNVRLLASDWSEVDFEREEFDLIIANDLFPNVDQRLREFLGTIAMCGTRSLLTLTWHQGARYYRVQRIDAEEIMTIQAWNGSMVSDALTRYQTKINNYESEIFRNVGQSIWENERYVAICELNGNAIGLSGDS